MKKYPTKKAKYSGKTKCWTGDYLIYCVDGSVITHKEAYLLCDKFQLKVAGAARTEAEPGELVEFYITRGEKILEGLFKLLER